MVINIEKAVPTDMLDFIVHIYKKITKVTHWS